MKELRLYSRAANRELLNHYVFSSFTDYLNELEFYRIVPSITINNYRINSGSVALSVNPEEGVLPLSVANEIVYIADITKDDEGHVVKTDFYFVDNSYLQSGYFVFEISLDKWASYMPFARFSNIHVTRCNREVDEGVYDEIKNTKGRTIYYYNNGPLARPINEYCVVILASVVVQTNFFGSDPLTQNVLLYIPLEDIASAVVSSWAGMDIIEKARFVVGGIYKTRAFPTDNNMSATRCWIMPKELVQEDAYGLAGVFTKTFVTGNADYEFQNVMVVNNTTIVKSFDFGDFLGGFASLYPNVALSFGSRGQAMPLTRFTHNKEVFIRVFVESGEVRAQVEQGNNIMDISSAFELDINANNQSGTALQSMSKTFSKFAGIAKSTAKGYMEGGYAGAAIGLLTSTSAAMSQNRASAPSSNNGDAATTYSLNDPDYIMFPLVISATDSANDEKAIAYLEGANFDVYIDGIAALDNYAHLGAVQSSIQRTGTFLKSDSFKVEGLNAEAEAYVRAELSCGVWLVKI